MIEAYWHKQIQMELSNYTYVDILLNCIISYSLFLIRSFSCIIIVKCLMYCLK